MSLRNAIGKQTVPTSSQHKGELEANEQRGKRAEETYSQLNVMIPKSLKLQFKSVTALHDTDMSEVCETLIRNWLSEQNI